jgi:hypothetical protein
MLKKNDTASICEAKLYFQQPTKFYIYYGLKFHTDSIAWSDGISVVVNYYTEKSRRNEHKRKLTQV